MRYFLIVSALMCGSAAASPYLECGQASSEVEVGQCLLEMDKRVTYALSTAYEIAQESAADLDQITDRDVAVPALKTAQQAWHTYRDTQCEAVAALYGGGSGTGKAYLSCRIELGRAQTDLLQQFAQ